MLAPASAEFTSVPSREILPSAAASSSIRWSFTFDESASVPSKTIELPTLSFTILLPASVPLESVPSKTMKVSTWSRVSSDKILSPSSSRVATFALSSVTNLVREWFPDSKYLSVDSPSVSNINKSLFCSDLNLS